MNQLGISCLLLLLFTGCLEFRVSTTDHYFPTEIVGLWKGKSDQSIVEFRKESGRLKLELYDIPRSGPWTRTRIEDSNLFYTRIKDRYFLDYKDEDGYYHTLLVNILANGSLRLDPIEDSLVEAAGVRSDQEFRQFVSDHLYDANLFNAGDTLTPMSREILIDQLVARPMKRAVHTEMAVLAGTLLLLKGALESGGSSAPSRANYGSDWSGEQTYQSALRDWERREAGRKFDQREPDATDQLLIKKLRDALEGN